VVRQDIHHQEVAVILPNHVQVLVHAHVHDHAHVHARLHVPVVPVQVVQAQVQVVPVQAQVQVALRQIPKQKVNVDHNTMVIEIGQEDHLFLDKIIH